MSLPWFSFYVKDFIADTARLDTEAKGAYLMLLLDYYQHEQGAPDVARVLATVTGLPLERWLEHSTVILPLFEVRDGRLYHQRCEDEITDRRKKYGQRLAAGEASVVARAAKRAAERAGKRTVERAENDRRTPNAAEIGQLERTVPQSFNDPLNEPVRTIREILQSVNEPLNGPLNETFTQAQAHIEEVGTNVPTSAHTFPAPLDPDFALTAEDVIRCQNDGATVQQISAVFDGWKAYAIATGNVSHDWRGSWWTRWERDKPSPKAQVKPRLEVSNRKAKGIPLPEDWEPNAKHAAMCEERGINLSDLADTFRDYCAQAANRTKYSDHDAAFRTFIRNQKSFTRGPNGTTPARRAPAPSRGSIVSAADEAIANIDRAIEAAESGDGVREEAVPALPDQRLRQSEGGTGGDGDGSE